MVDQTLTGELRRLLEGRGVRAVYQPIVDLETGEAVAYEALARGPSGSELEHPRELFGWAGREGLMPELDMACRAAAIAGAVEFARDTPTTLFINVEPDTVGSGDLFDPEHQELLAASRIQIVVELTERALTSRPAELLREVERLRRHGVAIALDDVGIDDRSLALMPFVQPDVIKLDMRLVQDAPTRELARVANAVWAESERGGALVLAEGIEDEAHLRRARAMGARLGQGWMFGRPSPLDSQPPPAGRISPFRAPASIPSETPFEVVTAQRETARGDKRILLERSLQLEAEAFGLAPEGVVLATFQDNAFFTPITARRYHRLGRVLAFVAAFGGGMPDNPIDCVRGGSIEAGETLRGEWNVIVLGPHFAGAFVARDLGDAGPDDARRFDFAMTYERDLVVRAARSLMARVVRS